MAPSVPISIRVRALWWKMFHRPVYRAGQVVKNRYEQFGSTQTLKTYLGPDIGYQETKWGISELWRSGTNYEVSVGFFWMPVK